MDSADTVEVAAVHTHIVATGVAPGLPPPLLAYVRCSTENSLQGRHHVGDHGVCIPPVSAHHMPGYVGFEALGLDLPESRTRTYNCKLSKLLIDFTRRRWSEPSGRLHKQALQAAGWIPGAQLAVNLAHLGLSYLAWLD
ncbi:hypothetical protein ACQJBY_048356 [Aegilops geniculata]